MAPTDPLSKGETGAIAAFKELVVKLNDAAFRPLFRRLYDWAFVDAKGLLSLCFFHTILS